MVTNFENNLCSRMCMILILEDINAKNCNYINIVTYFNPNDVIYTLYTLLKYSNAIVGISYIP